jgi:Protein of unknown function (DUF3037)
VPSPFDYAIVRVVPRVERGEQLNVGIIVSCPVRDFLAAEIALDRPRIAAAFPWVAIDELAHALSTIPLVAAADPRGGPIAAMPRSERFHWLVAPRSAVIQTSAVHTGICDDPAHVLARLMTQLVLPPSFTSA